MPQRWQDPTWLASAHAWIDARLAELGRPRTGDIEQPHVYPWSTVMRVPTAAGEVWFKATTDDLRHEAELTGLLAATAPSLVPPPLATDPATGWFLMDHAGETLRSVTDPDGWLAGWRAVLPSYAGLQIAFAGRVDELLALGVPDQRLERLPERYLELLDQVPAEPRFREALPLVVELRDRVAAAGVPETIQHDDLHDAQIFLGADGPRILDWGDSCVSHPFFTLSVSLLGVIAWGVDDVQDSVDVTPFRDAYLEPFVALYGPGVADVVEPAMRLGWVCRAVNGHLPGDDRQTLTRLRMFLDGRP